jgi:hypothetical protein
MTTTTTTTRRAVLAGIAAAPALGGAAIATGASSNPDPIFAAIEEHRAAYMNFYLVQGDTPSPEDDLIAEGAAYERAWERVAAADIALASVQPETLIGAEALLSYVRDFTLGAVAHPTRKGVYSSVELLHTEYVDDDFKNPRGNAPALPLLFFLMDNVRAALAASAGKAGVS